MARTFHIYVDPARVPTRHDWLGAIKRLGFRLSLDDGYVPFETSGYLPCTLEGEDAGVDLRFERDAAWPASAVGQAEPSGRTTLISLKWGGDVREQLTALILASALVQEFDALVWLPDDATAQPGASLIKKARLLVEENF